MVLFFTTKNSPALIRFFRYYFPLPKPSLQLKQRLLTQVLLDLAGHFCYHNVAARTDRRLFADPVKTGKRDTMQQGDG
jgi:hypothetical protein